MNAKTQRRKDAKQEDWRWAAGLKSGFEVERRLAWSVAFRPQKRAGDCGLTDTVMLLGSQRRERRAPGLSSPRLPCVPAPLRLCVSLQFEQ